MMMKRPLAASLLLALFCTTSPAFAGTTGSLKGIVVDAETRAPIAGAKVQVLSASQSASVTTDASGAYIFISLIPDTYTVTVASSGYDTQATPGQTILADQSSTFNVALAKTLKTIATTRTGSAASVVRPGTTSDVYSVNPAAQRATQALGGSGSLDQAYSAIASVPGVSIPSGQQGWYQSVFIRGGDYDQVAYEFDGVPVIRQSDGAPIVTLSALGQQEVQVYTGGTPATSDSPGLAGYINQVIKTGTSPGYASASVGAGAPAFYHRLYGEVGGASADRRFSYYFGLAGANQDYRYGDQFNGVSDPLYFYPLTIPTANSSFLLLDGSCGDKTLATACPAPYGAQFSAGPSWTQANNNDREMVGNIHFAIPHHHDSGRDDVQMLYVTGNIFTKYFSSANELGLSGSALPFYLDASVAAGGGIYNGPLMAAPDPANLIDAHFPNNPNGPLLEPIPVNLRDGGSNGYGIEKFQYQHNINDRSYLRAIGYGEYTNWYLSGPNSAFQVFGATLADYEVLGHIYGGSLIYANDLSSKHLLTASLSYQTQKLQTYNATFDTVLSTNPQLLTENTGQFGNVAAEFVGANNRGCFNYLTGAPWTCYDPSNIGTPANGLAPTTCIDSGTCTDPSAAAANAHWIMTENGLNAQVDNVTPYFTSISATDNFHPNDRWNFNIGARIDHFAYRRDNLETGFPARQFWFDTYNAEHCSAPGVDNKSLWNAATGTFFASCSVFGPQWTQSNLVNSIGGTTAQNVFQPRVAFTYVATPDTVWRGSYGRYARPAATSYKQYNTYQQDLPSFIAQFSALGYNSPDHDVLADTSDNFDFSYERHFPGTHFSLKASPFYRTTKNQLQYLNISALGGTLAGINVGTLKSYGLELALQLGDFSQDGLSGQLSYTYTNTHTRYESLSNGLNVIDVLNRSIEQYNSYTSACAANENTPQCGNGLYAANGAASFTNTLAAGGTVTVPNPYFASAPQPLMDSSASYVPYDVIPSSFASANSYAVPNVASLVLNYKHKNFSITPSFTYNSGSYYGSPLSVPGYVPQACTQVPSATVVGGVPSPTTPGASCSNGGVIFVPDPYTGRFDGLGTLREPSQLTMNLQLAYQVNKRMTLTVLANNLFNQCYQRGYVWDTPTACWYSSLPSNILPPNGPGTQPGAFLTDPPKQLAYPYGIWFNNTQVGITSARQPFQLTFNLDIKL